MWVPLQVILSAGAQISQNILFCSWGWSNIQSVSKMLGHTSGVSSPHQNKEKVHINTCWQKLSLCGTAQQCAELNLLDFYLLGHLKTLEYSAPIENRETLHQHIYDICQTIHNCRRSFQNVRQSMIRHIHSCTVSGRGHFEYLMWIVTW
jgi:hypothetical protein